MVFRRFGSVEQGSQVKLPVEKQGLAPSNVESCPDIKNEPGA
jgi:hypothetical protein